MIKVVFYNRPELRLDKSLKHFVNKRENRYMLGHCFIETDCGLHLDVCGIEPRVRFDSVTYTEILLPIKSKPLVSKAKELLKSVRLIDLDSQYESWGNFSQNPKALVSNQYTCVNFVAKLLGINDYWKMDPDDLYWFIQRQVEPVKFNEHYFSFADYGESITVDVLKLWSMVDTLPEIEIDIEEVMSRFKQYYSEFDDDDWVRVEKANTKYPILYNEYYGIIDGCHRTAKLWMNGATKVSAKLVPSSLLAALNETGR